MHGVSGNVATAVRTVVVVILAWSIVIFGGQWQQVRSLGGSNLVMLILSGVATGLSWIFYFKALETGNVSKVAPIDKSSVVLVMIVAFLFLGEPMTFKTVAGGILIAAGTILLVL